VAEDGQNKVPAQLKKLEDYKPPAFNVESIRLTFSLGEATCRVTSFIEMSRSSSGRTPLVLDGGPDVKLLAVIVDGKPLNSKGFKRSSESLTIPKLPKKFSLSIITEIEPEKNTQLSGLYKSSGNFCTQCEAEGFRNITYYLDRPDVMTCFFVRIEGDASEHPVLLSNGNKVAEGSLPDGRHFVEWDDPWPKPSYLFALVAGKLACLSDTYKTMHGDDVELNIYATEQDIPKCDYAMGALKRSMQWDEEVYGLAYDLSVYNIVAVGDFNMGAMENKGLNVFNTAYTLADQKSATDTDFERVEGVIGHEYFHNWTGNRVTCRDWFQLSLKEGLTVFRDQEFSGDMGSRAVKRLDDVRVLRSHQFPEDAGPLAHPVRPESYIEINNFYTATVYNKGAEVIRMMHRIIGDEAFKKGMEIYFERHDGQAVTCEDFVLAMEAASKVDLGQFRLWYAQAGTPTITAKSKYNATLKRFELTLTQSCPATPGQSHKKPMHVPVVVGLVGADGNDLDGTLEGDAEIVEGGVLLHLKHAEQSFIFHGIAERPVPSYLRGFSAPVIIESDLTTEQNHFLMARDHDFYARWEAAQLLAEDIILSMAADHAKSRPLQVPKTYIEAMGEVISDKKADPALLAEILGLPSESYLGQRMRVIDPEGLNVGRKYLRRMIAETHFDRIVERYGACHEDGAEFSLSSSAKAKRRFKNTLLGYLCETGRSKSDALVLKQYERADNMTDRLAAMMIIADGNHSDRAAVLKDFYDKWHGDPLVLDKWFAAQSMSGREDTLDVVKGLIKHSDFTLSNPNRLRSVLATFSIGNQVRFHSVGGEGYQFLAEIIKDVDRLNPQVAARLITPLGRFQKFNAERKGHMIAALRSLQQNKTLSNDLLEMVNKSLTLA